MAPYPIFFRALKTIIMPNFMLLTESEQLKHISALLLLLIASNRLGRLPTDVKQLLDEVFVISVIIKVEVRVISLYIVLKKLTTNTLSQGT